METLRRGNAGTCPTESRSGHGTRQPFAGNQNTTNRVGDGDGERKETEIKGKKCRTGGESVNNAGY